MNIERDAVPLSLVLSVSALGCALAQADTTEVPRAESPPQSSVTLQSSIRAADNPGDILAEIVVTAEKRDTSLQRTALAVTALTSEALEQAQVRTLADIQALIPSFRFGEHHGVAQITLRGIGLTAIVAAAEGPVAVHQNDIYLSRPIAQLSGLYDLESIEVLRGPQGTLYGRNATAGSVNIRTRLPTESWEGYARVTAGNYDTLDVEGAVSGPLISDKLLMRIAGSTQNHSGYGTNLTTGNDIDDRQTRAARLTLLARPWESFTATLIGEYFERDDNGIALHFLYPAGQSGVPGASGATPVFLQRGGYVPTDIRDITSSSEPQFEMRTVAVTGKLEWDAGPLTLRSITGYRDQDSLVITDGGGGAPTNFYFLEGEPAHQFSQELQINYDAGPFSVTGGAYYFNETDTAQPSDLAYAQYMIQPGGGENFIRFLQFRGRFETDARAVFAQVNYQLTQRLALTGGIRYSEEEKDFAQQRAFSTTDPYPGPATPPPVVYRSATFSSTTPKFGINFQATPDSFLYLTYAQGFKSGGFDLAGGPTAPVLQPEDLEAYEAGFKTTQLDSRLRLNLAAFYYDYTNLQVQQSNGVTLQTVNAASAEVYGLEAEMTALPLPQLQVDLTASYLRARFGDYFSTDPARPLLPPLGGAAGANTVNYRGNALPNAPEIKANLGAEYGVAITGGSISLRGEVDYSSKMYFHPNNLFFFGQDAFAKGNLFLTYESDASWRLTAFVRNVTDKTTRAAANLSVRPGSVLTGTLAPPRTYGLEMQYRF